MYIAKMTENGCKLFTPAYETICEARAEGRKRWQTLNFNIVEICDNGVVDGIYEILKYVTV